MLVIKSSKEIQLIIKDIHEGIGDDSKAKAMASHRGHDTTYQKIAERFFWHNIFDDVSSFVKHCQLCQKQGKMEKLISPELQSVPVPPEVMKQIRIDICNLPEVDGFQHLVVCIPNGHIMVKRRWNNVVSTSATSIQRCFNVVWPCLGRLLVGSGRKS